MERDTNYCTGEPILFAPGCDAKTFNANLKRFLADCVNSLKVRVSVGNSKSRGVVLPPDKQYINARLNYDAWLTKEIEWPILFVRMCALSTYPGIDAKGLNQGYLGCIMGNMITLHGWQWEQVAQWWLNERGSKEEQINAIIASGRGWVKEVN